MLKRRARIGVIIPSVNVVLEPDLYALAPKGISMHFSRIKRGKVLRPSLEDEFKMNSEIERAASELGTAEVDIILYGCTGGSFLKGVGYDKGIIDRIEKETNIRATTTSTAVVNGLRELGVWKIAVATPYPRWLNDMERDFLESSGFKVVDIKGLESVISTEHATFRPTMMCQFIKQIEYEQSDCVFISCTNFPAIEIIKALEDDLGKPIVTSNQASLWQVLRMLEVTEPIKGYGTLLESHI